MDGGLNAEKFCGPLFIVGMPRSGTKLIRDLLNQNPAIGIPIVESHFIPYMVKRFGNPFRVLNNEEFHTFYNEFTNTGFFLNMSAIGLILEREELRSRIRKVTLVSLFEIVLKFYAPPNRSESFIWGDKTPGYLNHMELLKWLYPSAKFIHIIRDPRDYCLSVKKTWGKNIYRAAERWRLTIEAAKSIGEKLGNDYLEIYYESLLEDPMDTMNQICEFLDRNFEMSMIELDKPSENLGDARGYNIILRDNKEKFFKQLNPTQVKRIEEIVFPIMRLTPYEVIFANGFKPINRIVLVFLTLYDGWAMFLFNSKEKGFLQGIKYLALLYPKSSWRSSTAFDNEKL